MDTDKKFLIGDFANRKVRQYPFKKLEEIFKRHGVDIASENPVIIIYNIDKKRISQLKKAVKSEFEKRVKGVTVSDVIVVPRNTHELTGYDFLDIKIKETTLNRTKGTFQVALGVNGQFVNDISFSYFLKARQKGIFASKKIGSKENITSFNTYEEDIPVRNRFMNFIDKGSFGNVVAKVIINKDMPVLKKRVKKAYDVKKGTQVKARVIEGGVILDFYLTSKKDGYIGDRIKLINQNQKIFYGKIIGKGAVEIE